MRRFLRLLILPILIVPAVAQEPPKPAAPPPTAAMPAPKPAAPAHPQARQTWEERFTQANVAHDGHLTPEEAKTGYTLIAKHFNDIDVDHKGYVTENDIRAWRIMRKAAHRLTRPPEDRLKPQHAYQWHLVDPHPAAPARTAALGGALQTAAQISPHAP
jgi:hypothetical protein